MSKRADNDQVTGDFGRRLLAFDSPRIHNRGCMPTTVTQVLSHKDEAADRDSVAPRMFKKHWRSNVYASIAFADEADPVMLKSIMPRPSPRPPADPFFEVLPKSRHCDPLAFPLLCTMTLSSLVLRPSILFEFLRISNSNFDTAWIV